ncbi:alanine racemase [Ruania zhangjianzhongii]|uniref:alanine racemase n=1 Tax=Ruania zhangjianzhongii TaxID=2603206 RepID=UPI0011C93A4E|nr:alanine racemase [Ruania zhangjianzhongii]
MFLSLTQRRNPALLDSARELHAYGRIGPDTYVLDLDVITENAQTLAATAAGHQIEPWFVTKQIGRVPPVAAAIAQHIRAATAIDVREARAVTAAGVRLGNVGHLVQVPRRALPEILASGPAYVTVFDLANLRAVAEAAAGLGIVQPVLLRIAGDPATTYPGQEGGIEPAAVAQVLDLAAGLEHVQIAGVTAFPCLLFDDVSAQVRPTPTADRALAAADVLRTAGIDPVINLPSQSSCSTIPLVAALGGTHVEPGHALTGTTPEHAVRDHLPERPGMVYVSEIAQTEPTPAVFGGGFYARGHARQVLLGRGPQLREATLVDTPAENIDYYRRLRLGGGSEPELGEVALMAFRTQIFVTRSQVAVVAGIQSGSPQLVGLFDATGRELSEVGG